MQQSTFNPARARDVAKRLREGKKPTPMFTREIQKPGKAGVVVITSIGKQD